MLGILVMQSLPVCGRMLPIGVRFKVSFTCGGFVWLIGETDSSVHLRFLSLLILLTEPSCQTAKIYPVHLAVL